MQTMRKIGPNLCLCLELTLTLTPNRNSKPNSYPYPLTVCTSALYQLPMAVLANWSGCDQITTGQTGWT